MTPPHRVYELLVCPDCGRQVGPVIHPHEGCERVNGLGVVIVVAPLTRLTAAGRDPVKLPPVDDLDF